MRKKLIKFFPPQFKDIVSHMLIISLSLALLWHFSNIWIYGQYLIGEPNIIIRSLETVGLLVIYVFGIHQFIHGLKGLKNRKLKDMR